MPKLAKRSQEVATLRAYTFHGLDFNNPTDEEAITDCPFCGRESKLSVNTNTSQWRCFVCGTQGGIYTFLDLIWQASYEATTTADYKALAEERGLDEIDTLIHWHWAKSIITGHWMLPGLGTDHKGNRQFQQLYVYTNKLLPTPLQKRKGQRQTLLGLNLYEEDKTEVALCEGPWDAMRLWEVMRTTKIDEEGALSPTCNVGASVLANINVLGVPGCGHFADRWAKWFRNKTTMLLYDNDHPVVVGKRTSPPAGTVGMRRVAAALSNTADQLHYLNWGEEGYDPNLPSGYDLRDILKDRAELGTLLNKIEPVPDTWVEGPASSQDKLQCRTCTKWKTVVNSWRVALKWADGLDHALAVMLASIASTRSVGDQLWVKIIGPASCGKSTLCEALSTNKKYVLAKSTIRGFHSGYKTDGKGQTDEDNSLLSLLDGKTLVTKDGDTLLQAPNLSQILGEGRDVYDGVSRTHYRNKMSKDYEGFRMTWILCGTSSLRSIDSSELGERFLDCVIMDGIDEREEDEILWRVANKAIEHTNLETNCEAHSQHAPDIVDAYELTGGYIDWLREKAATLLPRVEFSKQAMQQCLYFGKFVAYMRARPSKLHSERGERELAARLVSQHVRLAKCLAVVLNETTVDGEVLQRVRRVCLDTARGIVYDITTALYKTGEEGMEHARLLIYVSIADGDLRSLMRFLREIGIVELVPGVRKKCFRLTDPVYALYKHVVL